MSDMRIPRSTTLAVALLGMAAITVACSSSAKPTVSAGQPGASATVVTRSTSAGTILADASGRPLYTFANDQAGATTSACTGGCATAWPPLMATGTPTAGQGVTGTLAKLASGQVTLDGHPLYTFASDTAGGNPTGDGVSGFHLATPTSGASTATTASGSGYHY